MTKPISALKVGDRFTWIPRRWYGPARLTAKRRRTRVACTFHPSFKMRRRYVYDLVFDAAVINPPGIEYGIDAATRVRLLKRGK